MKKRVLYVLQEYPQLSETYIYNEIEHVSHLYELEIFALNHANLPYKNHRAFTVGGDEIEQKLDEINTAFKPDVVHFHYLTVASRIFPFCQHYNLPFTIRAHSFDVMGASHKGREAHVADIANYAEMFNSPLCQGVLIFPFMKELFLEAGVGEEKIMTTFPVADIARFYDTSENGDQIINMGAALGKKDMESFLRLAALKPDLTLNLHAIGYSKTALEEKNEALGGHCNIIDPVEPEAMPAVYKKHRWLVYTANDVMKTVGWPVAVAEAQASGVGVCVANIRPDMADYIGEGGGVLFDDVEEIKDLIAGPVPEEMRARGFELCWRSDIATNIGQLSDLWDGA